MKIGILYICTGKYSVFWENFYKTCEENFLEGIEKHYFIFTDNKEIKSQYNVHIKFEKPKGFPLDSLLRFKMFLSVQEKLKEFDYLFFFNSNMSFVQKINSEMLPLNDQDLIGVLHPGYYNKNANSFPFERNKRSNAHIKFEKEGIYHYFMGGVNGGKADSFIELSQSLSDAIDKDLQNNIMAVYHDESHINRYFHDKGEKVLILDSSYGYPEDSDLPLVSKIIIMNKIKHAGKYFDKLPKTSYFLRLRKKIVRLYNSFIWKYQ